jgi:hypothetical protein
MKLYIGLLAIALFSFESVATEMPSIVSAKCTFSDSTSSFFDDGKLSWRIERNTNEKMEITFDQLNSKDGKGRLIGNNGSGDVSVLFGQYELTLLEITGGGNVMITSLQIGNGYDHAGRVQAVHSRHPAGPTALLPSQRVGTCIVYLY